MKFDHKELFLYDTYSRIEGVIGVDRATQVYGELSEHVDFLQREHEERGLQPELAKHAALRAMGTPRSIATEFARHSVSKPWRNWPLWVGVFSVMAYLILRTSPSQSFAVPMMVLLAPFMLIGGYRNRRSLPVKPMLFSAAMAFAGMSLVESRSVRVWAERVPYFAAHTKYLSMQKDHAQFLEMEGKVARETKELRAVLIAQELQAGPNANLDRHSVDVPILTYKMNPNFYREQASGSFSFTPVLTKKQYSVGTACVAIDEKLATISFQQAQRRNQMNALGMLLNTSSLNRVIEGVPYMCFAIGATFGAAYMLSMVGANIALATVTRRRRILS